MAGTVARLTKTPLQNRAGLRDPLWLRILLISLALLFIAVMLALPLVLVFRYAFREGIRVYLEAFTDEDALSAIWLTLGTTLVAVPFSALFGLTAAWAITKFNFRGKNLLITFIDLPFAVSPVVAGLVFMILFGNRGYLGPWLQEQGLRIVFNTPGLILVTMFVTFPFVARELIPLMQTQGTEEEYAALSLGANGFQTFFTVTLPNVKWALFYGLILCNARAMGEFGASSVVSGNIRGLTNTLPLHIEALYNDHRITASFAMASLLACLAVLTLILKSFIEWRASHNQIENTES